MPNPAARCATAGLSRKHRASHAAIRQSTCAVCGKKAPPGSAIVLHFGAGGRVHKFCAGKESKR